MSRKSLLASFLLFFTLSSFFILGIYLALHYQKIKTSGKVLLKDYQTVKRESKDAPTPAPKFTKILLTGDIMLGRTVMTRALDLKDPIYPFREVGERLASADLVFANLENPIIYECPSHTTGFKFCASPEMVKGLNFSDIDVVTLANNHILNYGQTGFNQTKEILAANGISYTGDDNLVVKTLNEVDFGFLGFSKVGDTADFSDEDIRLVRDSDEKVDVLIAGVHWGNEYRDKANDYQKNWAKELIQNGVDIIAGHHPHWVQDYEYIEGKPVYYSLGNFIFDQMWSKKTREGMVVEITFEGEKITNEDFHEIYMRDWAKPEWLAK